MQVSISFTPMGDAHIRVGLAYTAMLSATDLIRTLEQSRMEAMAEQKATLVVLESERLRAA